MNLYLPVLGHIVRETNLAAAREARRLAGLVRRVARLEPDAPLAVVEAAADAVGWQRVRVLRALEGKESP